MNMCEFHKDIGKLQKYCVDELMKSKSELIKIVEKHGTMCLTNPNLGKDEEKYRISCKISCPMAKPKVKVPKAKVPKVKPTTPKVKPSPKEEPRRSTRKRRAPKRYM